MNHQARKPTRLYGQRPLPKGVFDQLAQDHGPHEPAEQIGFSHEITDDDIENLFSGGREHRTSRDITLLNPRYVMAEPPAPPPDVRPSRYPTLQRFSAVRVEEPRLQQQEPVTGIRSVAGPTDDPLRDTPDPLRSTTEDGSPARTRRSSPTARLTSQGVAVHGANATPSAPDPDLTTLLIDASARNPSAPPLETVRRRELTAVTLQDLARVGAQVDYRAITEAPRPTQGERLFRGISLALIVLGSFVCLGGIAAAIAQAIVP